MPAFSPAALGEVLYLVKSDALVRSLHRIPVWRSPGASGVGTAEGTRIVATEATPGSERVPTRWVRLARACALLGVNESTVRRWADAGEIHVFRTPGRHRRFSEGELIALVEGRGRRDTRELPDAAASRIRRQLHSGHAEAWYADFAPAELESFRALGRRLVGIVDDYISKRGRRTDLEEEVGAIGEQYGRELRANGMPLGKAVQAFTFFRRSLDEAAKQLAERNHLGAEDAARAREQIAGLADRVLVGLTAVYDAGTGR